MRILLLTNHFDPENFKCNDVAYGLAEKGHDVTVLTAIPDYPKGKFYKGYGVFSKRCEKKNGVKIIRSFLIPRGKGGGLRLALNYLSLAFFQTLMVIWLALRHKYDIVLVHETSPVTVGIPAVVYKKLRGAKLFFWVLDLWPESLSAAGGIKNGKVLSFFSSITKWIYRNSDKILMSSKGFENSICKMGDFRDKLEYFPNWPDNIFSETFEYNLPKLPNGFRVMFAGNIGEAQDFDNVMEAAKILKEDTNIHFVIVGDGRKRVWMEEFVSDNRLESTVHWVGRHPLESMPLFFKEADVMLVSLKDVSIFSLTVPAKIQAYMSSASPIIAMINGEGSIIIEEADCGKAVPAGDASALADAIRQMSCMSSEDRESLGKKGKEYCDNNFSFERNMSMLEGLL